MCKVIYIFSNTASQTCNVIVLGDENKHGVRYFFHEKIVNQGWTKTDSHFPFLYSVLKFLSK